jgi:hypothetical protein
VIEQAKKAKVLRQAYLLFTVLAEERPGDLKEAWETLLSRGKEWEKRAIKGKEAIRKLHPGTRGLTDLLRR